MARVMQEHYIQAEDFMYQAPKEYGAVLAVIEGIDEILLYEEWLFFTKLVIITHVLKTVLHIFKNGVDCFNLTHSVCNNRKSLEHC